MSLEVLKVVYQLHMVKRDENGNVIDELTTQQPITLYAHQLANLPDQVAELVAQAEEQQASQDKTTKKTKDHK